MASSLSYRTRTIDNIEMGKQNVRRSEVSGDNKVKQITHIPFLSSQKSLFKCNIHFLFDYYEWLRLRKIVLCSCPHPVHSHGFSSSSSLARALFDGCCCRRLTIKCFFFCFFIFRRRRFCVHSRPHVDIGHSNGKYYLFTSSSVLLIVLLIPFVIRSTSKQQIGARTCK